MDIWPVVNQIIMLFLLIGVGLLLRRMDIFSDGIIKGVNALVLTITWPMLMIATTQKDYTAETLSIFASIFFGSVFILGLGLIATFAILRKTHRDVAPVMAMLCIMPNTGFFGIPIIEALYGDIGLLYLSAYIVGFNIVQWTVAVVIYNGFDKRALRNLVNPGLVFAALGIALFLLRIHLPSPVMGTVNQLAAMNTPLSMLILGARMTGLRPIHLVDSRLWISIAVKHIALPLMALVVFRLMGMTGMTLIILVGSTAMPAAAAGQMMTERYGGDLLLSAKGTSVSTLCSIITLPATLFITSLFA